MPTFLTKLRFSSNRIIAAMRAVVGKLPTAYMRTKFEGRSLIRLRNIGTFPCGALIDPVTLTFDLEVGVGVACDLEYPCAKFRLPRPFGFRVRADVRDIRQTDRQTDDDHLLMLPPPYTGREHNNFVFLSCLSVCLQLRYVNFYTLNEYEWMKVTSKPDFKVTILCNVK